MIREDIIRMAREAGATRDHPEMLPNFWTLTNPDLERFANLVAAAEREACSKTCEEYARKYAKKTVASKARAWMMLQCAAAIRARGQD